jgi:hypothetical protein
MQRADSVASARPTCWPACLAAITHQSTTTSPRVYCCSSLTLVFSTSTQSEGPPGPLGLRHGCIELPSTLQQQQQQWHACVGLGWFVQQQPQVGQVTSGVRWRRWVAASSRAYAGT